MSNPSMLDGDWTNYAVDAAIEDMRCWLRENRQPMSAARLLCWKELENPNRVAFTAVFLLGGYMAALDYVMSQIDAQ